MDFLIPIIACLAIFSSGHALSAEDDRPPFSLTLTYERKLIEHLEHTMHLLCGHDGGLIGVALHLKNLSETECVKLHRNADGNVPLSVYITDKEGRKITQRATMPMLAENSATGKTELIWTLEPGESKWFFLPIRNLFDRLPTWDRIEGCSVGMAVIGIEPPAELLKAARKRQLSGDAAEARLRWPGIDASFRGSHFGGVALTQRSLREDAEKAYLEARREIDGAKR